MQSTPALGPVLRVATWNIEKSLNINQVAKALTSPAAYTSMINEKRAPAGSHLREEMLRQRQRLASADIVFLQEMDIGVNRSGYVDTARTLAHAMGMNYAYAPQALEVDPVLLGQEPRPDSPAGKPKYHSVDPAQYKGVFGSAILSRYPIVKVEAFQLKTQPYDWYKDEQKRADIAEHGRRVGSALVFDNEITRELKVGGRNYFRVDVAVPGTPGGVVSLINNHLEIKTLPKHREAQMVEILGYIKNIPHPVIMAGDHNSAPNDVSPTSVERVIWRQIDTPASFVSTASNVSGLVWGTMIPLYRERGALNALKNFQSPLAPNVPIIFPNHVVGLFNRVKEFRFEDGSTFDFRGDRERSINQRKGLLANSNDRRLKGQVTSFSVRRPIGPLGRYRLDWFFVKSSLLQDPRDKKGPYQFAPHYGETLAVFNEHLSKPLSDHRPLVMDLPLNEPALEQEG
ncbi:endonuclease/exonuclease/phosphatase family protein [Verrucomicrobium spinosum]|uniref:endonuclease/exonuclease/phosphatase family protein n=1 Tax=Verrucomicrobium spinosum TaxID=2736 RepID=UPI0001744B9E|nr:endonuclease/exonuclease/phosphatase family protein [Verrucomicrobium spinosum]